MAAQTPFTGFPDLAAHLESLGLFRMRPELGRLKKVLAALGDLWSAPETRPRAVVQVAGTNGKGSTCTFIASLAQAHGLRTGLFTSPHFVSFRERIRLNGSPLPERDLLAPANAVMNAGGEALTYFEFVTALAALVYSGRYGDAMDHAPVDLAVMETGLGGTWDAVTALPARMVAYTPIGLDHCRILGDTVAAIATDKAGAMRPGNPVFSAPQPAEAAAALVRAARERGCPITFTGGWETLPPAIREGRAVLGLTGEHQHTNAGLALAVWRALAADAGWETDLEKETQGLVKAFIPGRLQFVPACPEKGHPALILDGAHNGHGMAALGKALARSGTAPAAVIFSCLEDKVPADMAAHLRALSAGPVFIPPIPGNPRAVPPEDLAKAIGLAGVPAANMADALAKASAHVADRLPEEAAAHPERHPVLVCGSLYMLGDFFALRPDCLER